MRIMYVTNEYIDSKDFKVFDGGLANYLYKITTFLAGIGHDVTVVVANSSEDKKTDYNGVHVVWVSNQIKKTLSQRILWLFTSKKTREKIRNKIIWDKVNKQIKKINNEKKIDIIQYTNCLAKYTDKYSKKIPYCIRISSYAKLWQKYYSINNLDEIKNEISQFKKSKFLYGPSKHIADYIKSDLKLKQEINIIETPFMEKEEIADDSLYQELQQQIGRGQYILFFGTIGELKGCKVIADCIYDILEQNSDLYLVLVGKNITYINNTDYLEMIKNKACEFSDRVIRYPSLEHKQLYPIIKNSTGVLMPSLTENFSNACVEAMRLKKIVIGTEGNFSQLITDGINGFLSKVGDSESLKEKITELINLLPEQKTEMEQRAYERTESLLPEKISSQLLNYYQYVIEHWEY